MPEIILYSKPACVQCGATERYLTSKGLAYTKVDMSTDEAALERVRSFGYMSAPAVEVREGNMTLEHWCAFRPDLIDAWSAKINAPELASV